VVFNSPIESKILIKRCIALPGDTLLIDSSYVYINGIKQVYSNSVKLKYEISTNNLSLLESISEYNIHDFSEGYQIGCNQFRIDLDSNQLCRLIKVIGDDSIIRYYNFMPVIGERNEDKEKLSWSVDSFGPLIIPRQGKKIKLDLENYKKYHKTIKFGENHDIAFRNDSCFIDNMHKDYYTFKSNYYFLMGDNRYNSRDSRYFGMIPEELLIGQSRRILFSYSNSRFNWERFLKKIN